MSSETNNDDDLITLLTIENLFDDEQYIKQFDSPTGSCPTTVPILDCEYLKTIENASGGENKCQTLTGGQSYRELKALIAVDSEAGSPRPRRHVNEIRRMSQQAPYGVSESRPTLDTGTTRFRCRSATTHHRRLLPSDTPVACGSPLRMPWRQTTTKTRGRAEASNWVTALPAQICRCITNFCDGGDLTRLGRVCRALRSHSRSQPSWQPLLLEKFGFKYENYSLYTGDYDWYKIYGKASTFVHNLRHGEATQHMFRKILDPIAVPDYEGSMALTADNKTLLWDNGKVIQAVDLDLGIEIFRVTVEGDRANNAKPCIVNTNTRMFFHLDGRIHTFCLLTGRPLQTLSLSTDESWQAAEFCLDISIRNLQLAFLTNKALHIWDSVTLTYLYKVVHQECTDLDTRPGELDFLWAGYGSRCCSDQEKSWHSGSDGNHGQQLRPSKHIVVWLKNRSPNIQIHTIESGDLDCMLYGDSGNILRVRQCVNMTDTANYYLATLNTQGTICIWDSSSSEFSWISRVHTEDPDSCRLALTPTNLFVMSDVTTSSYVHLKMWRFKQPTKREAETGYQPWRESESETTASDSESLEGSGSSVLDLSAEPKYHTEGLNVLLDMHDCKLPTNVYFGELIDNQFLGIWYAKYQRGTSQWSRSESHWEVYDSLKYVFGNKSRTPSPTRRQGRSLSIAEMACPVAFRNPSPRQRARRGTFLSQTCRSESPESPPSGAKPDYLLSRRCFKMLHRSDVWSLLDWKSISIMNDGSLMVYDFCPNG